MEYNITGFLANAITSLIICMLSASRQSRWLSALVLILLVLIIKFFLIVLIG